ncbi:MAG: DEAD/DEAH box helicase family protein [Bacteroidetes bacterium]|jgi:type I restriction enzyme R subunit|nr:DEAD/DEAH box helicase family protein [Bacteroidota bacterium]
MPSTPEGRARKRIDAMLAEAGWVVQDASALDLSAGQGVALREFSLATGAADYVLFVDRQAVGVIEAKKEGTTLSGVAEQSGKYVKGLPADVPHVELPLPFAYESTGTETNFRDTRDPHSRSRRVFHFHQPETLARWSGQDQTLRTRLQTMPPIQRGTLRDCQFQAITGLERSLAENRPRALVQMATGAGKTFMAVTQAYRLLKHANAHRILFLVDRTNLGRQTEKEFQQYTTADDGRKFTELYNVQLLQSHAVEGVSDVCISTIQRVYSMLRGRELDPLDEEQSLYEHTPEGTVQDVAYNPDIPPETFDFVIVDESHRSIYNLWRQVIEYFDAFVIGLTATPSKQTFGFFNQNMVSEYPYERSVADGVNVGYNIYRIRTKISEEGSAIEAGQQVVQREKKTRRQRIQELDEELEYTAKQLDRSVTSIDQIRTVIKAFRDRICTDIFPNRSQVPKTLIFCKDDNHAEEVLAIVREEFGRGNEFAKKVTYTVQDPEAVIKQFRNSPLPRIVVSVDMIATGTDIKPLEVLLFLRDVKSSVYFDQMKGRGTRTIDPTDLQAVTGDAKIKDHFVLVDAVGVTENDKTDTQPLDRKPSVLFDKLMRGIALGSMRNEDSLCSLADRLARMNQGLTRSDRKEITEALEQSAEERGHEADSLPDLINGLIDATDADTQVKEAKARYETDSPSEEQLEAVAADLIDEACRVIDDPAVRKTIETVRKRSYITLDEVSQDEVLEVGAVGTEEHAAKAVESFQDFIETHKDEITALQIFYNQPYGKRHLTLQQIRELAEAIKQPPLYLTPEDLWNAYAQLERAKVKGAGERRLLTDIISLVRHAMGEDDELRPYQEEVEARFYEWLDQQDRQQRFTAEQLEWLELIKSYMAANLTIDLKDLQNPPFYDRGGPVRAIKLFGRDELTSIMDELNEAITA